MVIDALTAAVTGRSEPLFAADIVARRGELDAAFAGRRILVIGGAGSIGAATVPVVLEWAPAVLHVVDTNENALVELVRDLRASAGNLPTARLRTFAIDAGSSAMYRLLRDSEPYDVVLNFAAYKHVRGERDPYTLLHMLATNVLAPVRVGRWLSERAPRARYFCVSTDKAADPASLMGASKRMMELLVCSPEVSAPSLHVTCARFANVAFSAGSLLAGFLQRIDRGQPLAVPEDTRRYFISHLEAAQICLLAAASAPDRHVLVPRLDRVRHERVLEEVARDVLAARGLAAVAYHDPDAARRNVAAERAKGRYPVALTPRDTSGEKAAEELVGARERTVEFGLPNLVAVPNTAPLAPALLKFMARLEALVADANLPLSKGSLVQEIAAALPEMRHVETGANLEERM